MRPCLFLSAVSVAAIVCPRCTLRRRLLQPATLHSAGNHRSGIVCTVCSARPCVSPAVLLLFLNRSSAPLSRRLPILSLSRSLYYPPFAPLSLHPVISFFSLPCFFPRRPSPNPPAVSRLSPLRWRLLFSPLCPCILPRRESAAATAVAAVATAASFAGSSTLSPREPARFLRGVVKSKSESA